MNGLKIMKSALVALSVVGLAGQVSAQTPQPLPTSPLRLPATPTTKVLAIGRMSPGWTLKALQALMRQEVGETVELYLSGKLDHWYTRKDGPGVVFVLNVTGVDEAHDLLEALPFGRSKLMEFELIPLGPLAPLGLLVASPPS